MSLPVTAAATARPSASLTQSAACLRFRERSKDAHSALIGSRVLSLTASAGDVRIRAPSKRISSRVTGAVRDTELVPVGGSVTLAFDAGNPGAWMFHCHNLYHMLSGMATQVRYL